MFNVLYSVRRGVAGFALAGLAVIGAAATPAGAGTVTLVSQKHSISLSPGGGAPEEFLNAPASGPFNETFTRSTSGDGYDGTATGRLNATFAGNVFSFTGGMSYAASNALDGPEFAGGPTVTIGAQYIFSIDTPFRFELRSTTNVINPDAGALDEGDDQFFGDRTDEGETPDGVRFGVLQPGTHIFNINRRVTSFTVNPDSSRDFETEFDHSLVLLPFNGGGPGGPGPNPVPLPPAALAAGSVFGAMGLLRGGKRLLGRRGR
jgi:hypothetical protein